MSFQPIFSRFHEAIKLNDKTHNAGLREKRDRIHNRLREKLPYTFTFFNQGSYAMGTGIRPLNDDYDIDVGIVFNDVYFHDFDPNAVKKWVYDAVSEHTARVEWRRPCITVYYQQHGEAVYHVDLAIFARERNSNGLRLAIGKQHSANDQREWQPDDRKGFIEAVKKRFSGDDDQQFRRVIRYLKRWKDVHFRNQGNAAPSGLGLTVAAYTWFQVNRSFLNGLYDDLGATRGLVRSIRNAFTCRWTLSGNMHRLMLPIPFAPRDDVFSRMSDQQMQEFYQRLQLLEDWLDEAQQSSSTAPLQRAFGSDFPAQ
ncbi:MAG: nucleotidyltransferase [Proteobacteria bacterium]|nr:nucleotidyltransferase [Pseudomonadota bacterium]